MPDKELVSSSVLSQHPDTSSSAAAVDGVVHPVTGTGTGVDSGVGGRSSGGGSGQVAVSGERGDDPNVAAKRVLIVLASSCAAFLVLAVSVGVVCRVQCRMQRTADSCACAPPDGSGGGSVVIAGVGNGRGPSESLSTMGLLGSSNQGRHSFNHLMAKILSVRKKIPVKLRYDMRRVL